MGKSGTNGHRPLRNSRQRAGAASNRPKSVVAFSQLGVELDGKTDGENWTAACPFCDRPEKFSIHASGKYHCWVCQEAGNLQSFWREQFAVLSESTTEGEFRALLKTRKLPASWWRNVRELGLARGVDTWLVPQGNARADLASLATWKGRGRPFALASLQAGLFGARELRNAPHDRTVWIAEGIGDWIALHALQRRAGAGVVVVAVPGAETFKEAWLPLFTGRTVALCYDADEAGRTGMQRAAEKLAPHAHSVAGVNWPEDAHSKLDASDFIVQEHEPDDYARTWAALESLVQPVTVELPRVTDDGDVEFTELGLCKRFIREHAPDLRYDTTRKRWFVFDSERCLWRDDNAAAHQRMRAMAESMRAQVAAELGEARTHAELGAVRQKLSRVMRLWTRKYLENALALAQTEKEVVTEPCAFDADPFALNCTNGVVDLRTGRLRGARKSELHTKQTSAAYRREAPCAVFARFLSEIMPDAKERRYLQTLFGSALIGRVSEEFLPILHGAGENGKSKLLGILLHVLGSYAGTAPSTLLLESRTERHPAERMTLFGKRLVIASETESGRPLAEATVKELTGGDRIPARGMRENWSEFEPTHTLVLHTNHKPKIRGTDEGIWRRIRLIPFNVRIPKNQQDRNLAEKLKAEAEGVLAWLVAGARRYHREGLKTPPSIERATATYRCDEDTFGMFLAEHVVACEDATLDPGALHRRYLRWARAQDIARPWGRRTVTTKMMERGFEYAKRSTRYFRGIALR